MPRSPATLTSYYYCGAKGLAVASSMSACSPACQPPRRQAPIQPCWLLTLRQRWSASLAASAQGAISGSHTTPLQAHQAWGASTSNRAMKGHQHKRKKPRCRLSASRGQSCGCASACWRPGRAHQAIAGRGPGGCACSTGLLASAVLGCVHLRLALLFIPRGNLPRAGAAHCQRLQGHAAAAGSGPSRRSNTSGAIKAMGGVYLSFSSRSFDAPSRSTAEKSAAGAGLHGPSLMPAAAPWPVALAGCPHAVPAAAAGQPG